jgi:dihydroneopterin aldolase
VARRILDALKAEWPAAYQWKVRLVKERPPINGDVAEAVYTVEG